MRIRDVDIAVPIIQGGMGVGVSLAGLASAVANEGGVGVISSAGISTFHSLKQDRKSLQSLDEQGLRQEIRKARTMTRGLLGVNIMAALTDFAALFRVALEEHTDFVFMGAGLPVWDPEVITPDMLAESGSKLVPIVSSAKVANLIVKYWHRKYDLLPDALVVEGPLAGGHLGFAPESIDKPEFQLEQILPEVVRLAEELEQKHGRSIPVIAAGGIYTGADIRKMLELGAKGVQIGTRFVATDECDASRLFKEAYVNCRAEDIIIIKSPVGLPGRAIANDFLRSIESGHKKPFKCPYHCLKTCDYINAPYCIALALTNAQKGNLDEGFVFCGANAHRVHQIVPVKELMQTIQQEYAESFSMAQR